MAFDPGFPPISHVDASARGAPSSPHQLAQGDWIGRSFVPLALARRLRSTRARSSIRDTEAPASPPIVGRTLWERCGGAEPRSAAIQWLSLIHISEPTRLGMISYAVFCLKKKK